MKDACYIDELNSDILLYPDPAAMAAFVFTFLYSVLILLYHVYCLSLYSSTDLKNRVFHLTDSTVDLNNHVLSR